MAQFSLKDTISPITGSTYFAHHTWKRSSDVTLADDVTVIRYDI